MKKGHVKLTEADRAFLEALTKKGELKARAYQRAIGLLELDRGKCFTEVAETLQVSIPSISRLAKEYQPYDDGGSWLIVYLPLIEIDLPACYNQIKIVVFT